MRWKTWTAGLGVAALAVTATPAAAQHTDRAAGSPAVDSTLTTPRPPAGRLRPLKLDTSDHPFTHRNDNQGALSTGSPGADHGDIYPVGTFPTFEGFETRNFWTFDLAGVHRRISAAELVVQRYRGQSGIGDPTNTLGLFHVDTGARRLNTNTGPFWRIFKDLGSGPAYGAFEVATSGSPKDLVRMRLTNRAVTAINRARGGWFSVGGRLLDVSDSHDEVLFRDSGGRGIQRLILYPVPSPRAR